MLIPAIAFMTLLAAAPATAQQTRILVIPDGSGVAVPARGALPTVSQMAPRAGRPRGGYDATPIEDTGPTWRQAKQLWPLIPLAIAGALVAATLPGGGGGGAGAPAATR